MDTKDDGAMRSFSTGAYRGTSKGKGRYDLMSPIAEDRAAKWYEKGLETHTVRNWEKGIPLSSYLDSLKRHINRAHEGYKDEDHWAAARFNLDGLIHTEEMIRRGVLPAELNDLPNYSPPYPRIQEMVAQVFNDEGKEPPKQKVFSHPIRFYVAGPLSSPTYSGRLTNYQTASNMGLALMKKGHLAHVPHAATEGWHGQLKFERFMDLDLSIIEKWATAIYFIGSSPGADRELEYAKKLGLPIYTRLVDVPAFTGGSTNGKPKV